MRVYVIIQQALYYNSSYYDVVCVKSNLTDAKIVVETLVKDILSYNLLGDNAKVFYNEEIATQGFNADLGALVINDLGYYELITIENFDVDK